MTTLPTVADRYRFATAPIRRVVDHARTRPRLYRSPAATYRIVTNGLVFRIERRTLWFWGPVGWGTNVEDEDLPLYKASPHWAEFDALDHAERWVTRLVARETQEAERRRYEKQLTRFRPIPQ